MSSNIVLEVQGSNLILPWCVTKVELRNLDAWIKYDKDKSAYVTNLHCRKSNKLVQHLCNMLSTRVKTRSNRLLLVIIKILLIFQLMWNKLCGN